MRLVGAVDIGGTKIAVGIVREDGTVLCRSECATDPARGMQDAVERIRRMLGEAIERCGSIEGVGVGCPGPLDAITGVLGVVGTLPGWEGGRLGDELAWATGLGVAVENDADAAALAEYAWGDARTAGTMIYVTVSTGIGGGIVRNGQLYRGAHGAHPEFGHQVIDPSGPLCYCGLHGCWESLASGPAMSACYCEHDANGHSLTAAEICELARHGDALAMRAVSREAQYLALGLANLVTLFVPEVITLGGGVMKSSDLFFADVQAMVRRLCTQVPVEQTRLTMSSVGQEIDLMGAAQAWFLRHPM